MNVSDIVTVNFLSLYLQYWQRYLEIFICLLLRPCWKPTMMYHLFVYILYALF